MIRRAFWFAVAMITLPLWIIPLTVMAVPFSLHMRKVRRRYRNNDWYKEAL